MSPRASQSVHARTRVPTADRTARPPALPALARAACRLIYQHRILRTDQLQTLLTPGADSSYLRRCLRVAAAAGLVDTVTTGPAQRRAWFLTPAGYAVVEAAGDVQVRAHRMTRALAAGGLLEHRLAVAEVGIAFVTAAAAAGDECTPWSWTPEVLLRPGHRRGGTRTGALIADAVLHYERHTTDGGRAPCKWLIELDRGTYPAARLADKVATYVGWWATDRVRHPDARLLVVFDLPARTAGRRTAALVDELAAHPVIARRRYARLSAAATSLTALTARGPVADVLTDVLARPAVSAATGQPPGPSAPSAGVRTPPADPRRAHRTPTTVALPPGW